MVHPRPEDAPAVEAVPPGTSATAPPALSPLGARAAARLATTSPTTALDRLVGLAARMLGTGSAQLSLLSDVQRVAAGVGDAQAGACGPLADSLCTVTAAGGAPLVVPDAVGDPRVRALPPVTSGVVGAYLGVPLVARDGHVVGALCAFDRLPRAWSDADVEVLTELAEAAAAELELAALWLDYETGRLRWELSMAAGGVGSFEWERASGHLTPDDRLLEVFGYDRATFDGSVGSLVARVHPDDVDRVRAATTAALARGGEYDAEFRLVLPDRAVRWVLARGTALPGADGGSARLLGAVIDTTAGRDADARLSRVLETMSAAFYSLDHDWRFTYVNSEAEKLLGRRRDELLGGSVWDLFPAASGSVFETSFRRAASTGEPTVFEAHYPTPVDGWFELRVWPGSEGLSVYFLDITERRAAQQAAESTTRRLALLAAVSADLSGTLDARTAVSRLGRHVVPELGDWCIVTLLDDAGVPHDVGTWHVDPAMLPVLDEYASRRQAELVPAASFVSRAIETGRPALVPAPATEAIASVLVPGTARRLIGELAPHTAAVLPLRARGRTSGLITVARGPDRPALGDEDLATAIELTERAGLTLDNARLYGEQQRIAEGLQRSLLTAPVEPEHTQVVVRYQPAAQAARVGGDWYDAFQQPDGCTVLVIGDVVGHDIQAAAAMSQVRSLLRGIGYTTGGGPAAVLTALDGALHGLAVDTAATAVVARLERDPDLAARGLTRMRWSNAGHPPPMLLTADGTVTPLAGARNDLLLGVSADWPRTEHEVLLGPGATVLLYTDGLVERRGEHPTAGMDRLRRAIARFAGSDLDALVDGVLAELVPGPPDDDIALAAVRLHTVTG